MFGKQTFASVVCGFLALSGASAKSFLISDVVGDMVEIGGADAGLACATFGLSVGAVSEGRRVLNDMHRELGNLTYNCKDGTSANFFNGGNRRDHHNRRLSALDAEEAAATGCIPRGASLSAELYMDDNDSVSPVRVETVSVRVSGETMKLVVIQTPVSVLVYTSPSDVIFKGDGAYQLPMGAWAEATEAAVSAVAGSFGFELSFPERSCPDLKHRRTLKECGDRRSKRRLRAVANKANLQ